MLSDPLTVALGNVIDQLHDEDCLPNTSTSEKADLSTLLIGSEKVDNLWGEVKSVSISGFATVT